MNIEKYQAMKKYKNSKIRKCISNFIQISTLIVMLGLFLSSPLWLPIFFTHIQIFFMQTLPIIIDVVLTPTCLFVLFNLIIIFLISESRFSSSSAQSTDIYQEYVTHSKNIRSVVIGDDAVKSEVALSSNLAPIEDSKENKEEEESEILEEEEEEEEDQEDREKLHKRVESFIAKVNMQRRIEAQMFICGR